ncbi:MAG: DUF1828 domain-containing protein [Sulfuritalea sp.]|nr:DUF1828 domain-containing protein [Sulfuritalea sp.]
MLTDDDSIRRSGRSGCKLNSPSDKTCTKMTLNGFGVQLPGEALRSACNTRDNLRPAQHNLVQAMLAASEVTCSAVSTCGGACFTSGRVVARPADVRYAKSGVLRQDWLRPSV